jgi:Flp pilus assembly protein TadG
MKIVIAALLAAALLAAAGPAPAAPSLAKKVAALQAQVNAIKKQNTALKKQVTKLQKTATTADGRAQAAIILSGCLVAVTADAFQNTWTGTNQATGKTTFGTPVNVGDPGLCTALRVLREPTKVPPTIAPFNSLLTLLTGRPVPAWLVTQTWLLP